jgi:hypothetical protein
MRDEEFWHDVAASLGAVPNEDDEMEPVYNGFSLDVEPCPECGEIGACGYDSQGRPMIHALKEDDDG